MLWLGTDKHRTMNFNQILYVSFLLRKRIFLFMWTCFQFCMKWLRELKWGGGCTQHWGAVSCLARVRRAPVRRWTLDARSWSSNCGPGRQRAVFRNSSLPKEPALILWMCHLYLSLFFTSFIPVFYYFLPSTFSGLVFLTFEFDA